jgi:sulfatase modifying factor 1
MLRLLAVAALLLAVPARAEVTLDWVTVGNPGNACDTQPQGCFGRVAKEYRIAKHEITNAQYTEFLNAVAATDTNALYRTSMAFGRGGIQRSGSSGSYVYNAIEERENMPVNYVSFWDAARFANWLHNGQPTGAQNAATTENGAYTLTPAGIANNTITRNARAAFFVPREHEWYKAAYYHAASTSYFDYPTGSDTQTVCAEPGATPNTANCNFVNGDLVDVGSYAGAASPAGTFDQGGNVAEWNETIIDGEDRGRRGAAYNNTANILAASLRGSSLPTSEGTSVGFRLASPISRPYPQGIPALGPAGLLCMAAGLLAFAGCRARRPQQTSGR